MYTHAAIQVERPDVLTLPSAAVATEGNVNEGYKDFCFVHESDKVRRMPIEVGSRGEDRVQVLRKQGWGSWGDFTGEERVVQGELSSLADGER